MSNKSETLRLAAELEDEHDPWPRLPAAAELRRLHAENEAQQGAIAQFHHAVAGAGWHPGRTDDLLTDIIRDKGQELRRLHAQRDALLEALRAAVADWDEEVSRGRWLDAARAAITKAEEA